jgi:hypothetical protein
MLPLPQSILDLQHAPGVPLSKALIHAAALDAAERQMRRQGRIVLNEDDIERFHACFDRLFDLCGGIDGWIGLPSE